MSFPSDENSLKKTLQELKDALSSSQADSIEIVEALGQMETIVAEIENKAKKFGFIPQPLTPVVL